MLVPFDTAEGNSMAVGVGAIAVHAVPSNFCEALLIAPPTTPAKAYILVPTVATGRSRTSEGWAVAAVHVHCAVVDPANKHKSTATMGTILKILPACLSVNL